MTLKTSTKNTAHAGVSLLSTGWVQCFIYVAVTISFKVSSLPVLCLVSCHTGHRVNNHYTMGPVAEKHGIVQIILTH